MAARGGEELPVAGLPLGKSTMEDWSVCASGCALHCTAPEWLPRHGAAILRLHLPLISLSQLNLLTCHCAC